MSDRNSFKPVHMLKQILSLKLTFCYYKNLKILLMVKYMGVSTFTYFFELILIRKFMENENVKKLIVPEGVQYISEWADYELPKGEHCIVDKGVTGCGYTEYCLTNPDNVILCSPRKMLLKNKSEQHKDDTNIFYLENTAQTEEELDDLLQKLKNHISKCIFLNLPCKIMVTYDSLHHIVRVLKENPVIDFTFVVDEFQCIFMDAFFKAEVEFDFVETLQYSPSVVYLSATPMLLKYLKKVDEFKDLTYYELDWSKTGYVERVNIERKHIRSINEEISRIISQYLNGNFPRIYKDGKWYESKEAVFYVNSVTDIVRAVRKNHLTPANTIIMCAESEVNKKALKRIKFTYGKVPLKGEPNPMFMFCTKSVYVGVDMYSDNAKSYIFADPNIDSLALDISIDLPQIAGRQRDKSNPFKNEIALFYKIIRKGKQLTLENFNEKQADRRKKSHDLLSLWNQANKDQKDCFRIKLKSDVQVNSYSWDFISVSRVTNEAVYNNFIELADERAWEVSQVDYQDSINVTKAISSVGVVSSVNEFKHDYEVEIDKFCSKFYSVGDFRDKMRLFCDFMDQHKDEPEIAEILNARIKSKEFNYFYSSFGTDGCRSVGYARKPLMDKVSIDLNNNNIKTQILSEFKLNQVLSAADVKTKLATIYAELGLKKTAKATDLDEYFVTKRHNITSPDGKSIRGVRIVNFK